jgi:hypothetical protein
MTVRDRLLPAVSLALLAASSLCDCSPEERCGIALGYAGPNWFEYSVAPNEVSPGGIRIDTTGQDISAVLVDQLTDQVETCLRQSIDRGALVVKVPNDWTVDTMTGQQLLSLQAYPTGCVSKGETPSAADPCRWRAVVQCPSTIVTTPSFYLYKDALVRWVTGSQDPWSDPALAPCVQPATNPLSNGASPL